MDNNKRQAKPYEPPGNNATNRCGNREFGELIYNQTLIRSPLDQRLHELARKHCGPKDKWRIENAALTQKGPCHGCWSPPSQHLESLFAEKRNPLRFS